MSYLFITCVTVFLIGILVKFYVKLTTGWCRSHTCLLGKTAIVTGSNTGIGYETALDFAKRGARVILACRDEEKAEEAKKKIIEETGNENIAVKLINMNSFASVREFAREIIESEERLDILVNNAGAGGIGDRRSLDGQVLLMQINYFSSFLLTYLLIKKMSKGSRIVNVASLAAKYADNFDLDKLDKFPGVYNVYYNSKLCNILFTIELARRLEGTGITTYSLHPGAVKTDLFRRAKGVIRLVIASAANLIFKTSEEGAQTTIYCAVTKGIEKYSGEHFSDCKKVRAYSTVKVPGLSQKLWKLTEEIVHITPEEKSNFSN